MKLNPKLFVDAAKWLARDDAYELPAGLALIASARRPGEADQAVGFLVSVFGEGATWQPDNLARQIALLLCAELLR
jgi:hypothetical protein